MYRKTDETCHKDRCFMSPVWSLGKHPNLMQSGPNYEKDFVKLTFKSTMRETLLSVLYTEFFLLPQLQMKTDTGNLRITDKWEFVWEGACVLPQLMGRKLLISIMNSFWYQNPWTCTCKINRIYYLVLTEFWNLS